MCVRTGLTGRWDGGFPPKLICCQKIGSIQSEPAIRGAASKRFLFVSGGEGAERSSAGRGAVAASRGEEGIGGCVCFARTMLSGETFPCSKAPALR